jgi:predicted dehydrogenase
LKNERLDFVDVATPPASHAAIVLEALAKHVHVLCEKPLTTQWEECRRIRSAASAARAVVFTTHNWKYAPIFRTAKRTLRRGDIGQSRTSGSKRSAPHRRATPETALAPRPRRCGSWWTTDGMRSIWHIWSTPPGRSRP